MQNIILGAGGIGKLIAGVLTQQKRDFFFLDDALDGQIVMGVPVKGPVGDYKSYQDANFIVAYGITFLKNRIGSFERLKSEGFRFFNAVFPGIYVDETATLGEGNLLAANCAVMPCATIGNNCVVTAATTIDHDSTVGDHCYFSPGVNVAGGVTFGKAVFVGTNATILPQVKVGEHAVIGAGAVVTRDVSPFTTVVGVPAEPLETERPEEEV